MFTLNDQPADYELVPIGFDPSPLVEGEIDAMVCFVTNQPLILEGEGLSPVAKTYGELGLPLYADVLYAPRDYLEENKELVAVYLRALIRGWEHNLEDPELAAQLVVDEYGIDLGSTLEAELAQNEAQNELVVGPATEENGLCGSTSRSSGGRCTRPSTRSAPKTCRRWRRSSTARFSSWRRRPDPWRSRRPRLREKRTRPRSWA